jgi:hypothetical protein
MDENETTLERGVGLNQSFLEFLSLNHILPVFIALAGATVIAAVVNFFGARRALRAE